MQTPYQRLWRLLRMERKEIRHLLVYAVFEGLIALSLPLGIQAIINIIQAGRLSTTWFVLVFFVLFGILLAGVLQLAQMRVTEGIEQRLFAKASFDFAYRIPRFTTASIEGKYIPELINRFFEVSVVQRGLAKLIIDFSAAVIQVAFGLILISLYHPLFMVLGLLLAVIVFLMFRLTAPAGLHTSLRESKSKYDVAFWLEEIGRNISTFKLVGITDFPLQKTDRFATDYVKARTAHFNVLRQQYRIMIAFRVILAAGLLLLGSVLVVNGQINLGQFVATEIVILLILASVEKIILNMSTLFDVLTALEKLSDVDDIPLERSSGQSLENLDSNHGLALEVRNLSFKFPSARLPVIENLNFTINPGENVCISGPHGSGKTTLLRLLCGYYENYSGSILYNGYPLTNLKLDEVRSAIGVNFLEMEIFHGTLAENISCGRKGIGIKEVADAIEKAGLRDYVQSLPEAYDTLLDPAGQRLSGSISRRIMLARALASKPRLLLIEDNLGGLPQQERVEFFNHLFSHCRHITTLVVTNDDIIAKRCDRTLVLNKTFDSNS